MYIDFAASFRGAYILEITPAIKSYSNPKNNYISRFRHSLRFPFALYQFTEWYFRGHRTLETQGALYNIFRLKSMGSDKHVILELQPFAISVSLEANE